MNIPRSLAEQTQANKVNAAYAKTGGVNPEYEHEFNVLADMRLSSMANGFRAERGLPTNAHTPYCQ